MNLAIRMVIMTEIINCRFGWQNSYYDRHYKLWVWLFSMYGFRNCSFFRTTVHKLSRRHHRPSELNKKVYKEREVGVKVLYLQS